MNKTGIIDLLLHYGLDKETYKTVKLALSEENRNSLRIFSSMGTGIFFVLLACSLAFPGNFTAGSRVTYIIIDVCLIAIVVLNATVAKYRPALSDILVLVCAAATLAAGISLAMDSPGERVSAYLGILTVIPAMFCIVPLLYALLVAGMDCVMLASLVRVQSPDLYSSNTINVTVFSLVSIAMAIHLMSVKAKRRHTEILNKRLMETDRLTGIYNRRTYEEALTDLRAVQPDYTIIAFDLNGLKKANDSCGHSAGDELLCGAAECIRSHFGEYGRCFRTGGDEFAAILTKAFDREKTLQAFEKSVAQWQGQRMPHMSISYGMVAAEESRGMTVDEAVALADKRMYDSKSLYYRSSGIDRRKS